METVNIAGLLCRECVSKSQCYCLKDYDKQRELCSLNNSLMQSGFVQIVGHGVKSSLISNFFREAKSFFAESEEYKALRCSKDKARRGYSPSLSENFASLIGVVDANNDSVEKFRIGPLTLPETKVTNPEYYNSKEGRIHFYPNDTSIVTEDFPSAGEYYEAMSKLSKQLFYLILQCSGVSPNILDHALDKPTSILSVNHYSPVHSKDITQRVAPHSDVSVLTIVAQTAECGHESGSLEVLLHDEDGQERFVAVPYVPGALVVNVGDCLHYWSGGRYCSAIHRVVSNPLPVLGSDSVKPATHKNAISEVLTNSMTGAMRELELQLVDNAEDGSCEETINFVNQVDIVDKSRYSVAFFFSPNHDAQLSWPLPPNSTSRYEKSRGDTVDSFTIKQEIGETGTGKQVAEEENPSAMTYAQWRKFHIKKAMTKLRKK